MNPSTEECAICLDSMKAREGQALFTAECSHTFHFSCIASNVQHGNHICPTCRCNWTNLPSQFTPASAYIPVQPPLPPINNFADDEPLPSPEPNSAPTPRPSLQSDKITVKALPEFPALSRSEQSDSFSVLVGIRAPTLSPEALDRPDARAPVDLVAVLDISGSMHGDKLRLLKQAMGFVVDNLGPSDRLSVIVFSTSARRVTPLRRMTEAGRTGTIQAVNSLRAEATTNIISGLEMAVQVLEQRSQKNSVASIIFLSDGQDNSRSQFVQSLRHLPPCIRANAQNSALSDVVPVPVHTFGFGSDHDATALHAIADGSGGTFSYIESLEILQDAFAQCIGGLLSVVAQEVEIHLHSAPSSVQICSISSGRYRSTIENDSNQHGIVYVGDVYAEEEKQFLVNLSIPQALASSSEESDTLTTKLLEVKCSYKDLICNENSVSETVMVEIRRPLTENLSEADKEVCIEVDLERNRISIAEGIAQAQAMADRGEFDEAQGLLVERRERLMASSSGKRKMCESWEGELEDLRVKVSNRAEYERGGRAYALSTRNAHNYQRATTQAVGVRRRLTARTSTGGCAPRGQGGYETSNMRKMVAKSEKRRKSGN